MPLDAYDQYCDTADDVPDETPIAEILEDVESAPRVEDVLPLVLMVRRLMVGASRSALDTATEYAQEMIREPQS